MAGVHFSFDSFIPLIQLNIGMSDRIDENRAESFTILYCDFTGQSQEVITSSLEQVLRTSDAIVTHNGHYFFLLPYTDKYGAITVRNMFEEFFASDIPALEVSYPVDGENARQLLDEVQFNAAKSLDTDLNFLDPDKMNAR